MRTFNIKTPDKKIVPALQDKIDNLTKPKGSLGRLEELAVQIGTIQQSLSPVLRTPQNIVFAADHGVVVEGVSFSAPEVTAQQIYNFLKGGGGINMFARQHHFILKVVDCGVNADFGDLPGLIHRKIRKSTDNYLYGPAMTPEEMERAIEIGAEMVQLAYQEGTNIISFGELGMANTSASSVWMYFFTGIPLKECVGAGSGLDNQGIEHKYQVLKRATGLFGCRTFVKSWFTFGRRNGSHLRLSDYRIRHPYDQRNEQFQTGSRYEIFLRYPYEISVCGNHIIYPASVMANRPGR